MAKNESYLGIDIGGSSLKITELANVNNRPQLVTYGFIDNIPNIIKEDTPDSRAEIVSHLKHLMKESKVFTNKAVAALPSFSVFSSIINLPAMKEKDLISAVRWEAKKFVPIPLEEMILDWEILKDLPDTHLDGEKKDEKNIKKDKNLKGNLKVLLTAAPNNLVNRYVDIFKQAGLMLVGLETESFAIERALVGNDKNPMMVVDVGGNSISIVIYINGVPLLNRSIDIGGNSATREMVKSLGLSEEQTEQFKKDMSRIADKNIQLDLLPQQVKSVINAIVNEIKYILNIYQNQHKNPISKIVLTGGSSFLMNLDQYIHKIFNINCYIGDPWARVVHPKEIDVMLKQLGPRMAVSIGLAMREIV